MNRLLILLLSINLAVGAMAQGRSIPTTSEVQEVQASVLPEILPDSVKYRFPLFNGLSVSTNLFDPVMNLFKWDRANYEATVTADIHHRFFPQFTMGMGVCDEVSDDGVKYSIKAAPFFKVGMLYNFKYNDYRPDNFYYLLFRYGFSKSTADIENMHYTDGYWPEYGPTSVTGQDYPCHWIEIGGGIKVKIAGPVSLGWELTLRPLLSKGDAKYGDPYFVPGKGASKFAFAFNLYYEIFKKR